MSGPHGPHDLRGHLGPHGLHGHHGPHGPHGADDTHGFHGPHGPHGADDTHGFHGPPDPDLHGSESPWDPAREALRPPPHGPGFAPPPHGSPAHEGLPPLPFPPPHGPAADGPPPYPPPQHPPPQPHLFIRWPARRSPRVGRGDVRLAALLLLAEEPRNGYQIITEIERRSQGVWRPSPGSVYPALSQLEDEGLVEVDDSGDRKLYRLTPRGRAEAERQQGAPPWQAAVDNADDGSGELHRLVGQLAMAARQVADVGGAEVLSQARRTLVDARRRLYRILADSTDGIDDAENGDTKNDDTENEGDRA